ncbi:MAG TPA: flagellar basal body L-ring protein FlgH [Sphingomonas sp.]|jgi:flagellar basal body L-ring protein FlgH|nr:flagellar basal body L-ring protein FlgH [Sphingomonas sp.]
MTRLLLVSIAMASPAMADDLYRRGGPAALVSDQRAASVGDALTVLVFQSAESSNSAQNSSRKATDAAARLRIGDVNEGPGTSFGGGYAGRGEARRTERLVTQLSVTVSAILPNGDLVVTGRQRMHVNGEHTDIGVRGRVRPIDISSDNTVLSTRIADAEIDYGGKGFVSRGARPGLLNRVFSLLGLG